MNVVATIDGKITSGSRDEPVSDLGSETDLEALRRLDAASDAVLIGARTLRASSRNWLPKAPKHIVVSRSGDLPADARFLEGEAYVAAPGNATFEASVPILRTGGDEIDWVELLKRLREMGVERLYVLGGSEINAELLSRDLVDELFLTVAPKVKLGWDTPTYAGGTALPREALLQFELLESHIIGHEVFLRYRRERQD